MPDADLTATALDALEGALGLVVEDAHDLAVARAPDRRSERLKRVRVLRQVGADLVVLADACEVLLRLSDHRREDFERTLTSATTALIELTGRRHAVRHDLSSKLK
jgi:hypothetical protein